MTQNDERIFAAWTVGKRERQEDYCAMAQLKVDAKSDTPDLLVMADGMGGQAAGNVASEVAVSEFIESAKKAHSKAPHDWLVTAIEDANNALARRVQSDGALKGMGTTLVAVHLHDNQARWISVGDSPLFLVRGNSISRVNEDHSLAGLYADMADRGEIDHDEAARRGGEHQLRSAMMGEPLSLVDKRGIERGLSLQAGDVLVLATDGVLTLKPERIKAVVASARPSAKKIAEALIEAVNAEKREHQDNTTAIVYAYGNKNAGSRGPDAGLVIGLLAVVGALAVGALGFSILRSHAAQPAAQEITSPQNATSNDGNKSTDAAPSGQ